MGSTSAEQSAKSKHSGASTAAILSKYHHDDVSAVTSATTNEKETSIDLPAMWAQQMLMDASRWTVHPKARLLAKWTR